MAKSLADAKKQILEAALLQLGYELISDTWQTYEATFAKGPNRLVIIDHIKDEASVTYGNAARSFPYAQWLRSVLADPMPLEKALGGFDEKGGFCFPDFEVISHVVIETIAAVEQHASNNLMQPTGQKRPAADQGR